MTSSHMTMPFRWAFDLVTYVSILRGRERANSKANLAMRRTPTRVKMETSIGKDEVRED